MDRKNIENLEAIFFDIDNTLYDQHKAYKKGLSLVVDEFDKLFENKDKEEVVEAFFKGDIELMKEFRDGASLESSRLTRMKKMLELLGIDKNYAEDVNDFFLDKYPKIDTPIDKAIHVIERLRESYKLGVISNGSKSIQLQKLESMGLKNHFKIIVLSEEIGIRKPEKKIFENAASQFDLSSNRCMYVGNLYETDVVGANNAGMLSCWLNQHGRELPPNGIEPDFRIRELVELLEVLHNNS
ncbi:MAG: HAD family hydrolase [Thermoplasmatota archaeon]